VSGTIALEERYEDACAAAALEVLVTMFFELPLEEPALGEAPAAETLDCAEVEFDGSARGRLLLAAPRELTAPLARAFLAMDEEPGAAGVAQVFGELANMVCGSTLGRTCAQGSYLLAPPAVELARPVPAGRCWMRLQMKNGPLSIALSIDSGV
jgi:hypothetical protein